MSLYDYRVSIELSAGDSPFYALIMAARCGRPEHGYRLRLRSMFPATWDELRRRYEAPGGVLPEEVAYSEVPVDPATGQPYPEKP